MQSKKIYDAIIIGSGALGRMIHEMGGVRMGNDMKTSAPNKFNQMHEMKNVFVTDAIAAMFYCPI